MTGEDLRARREALGLKQSDFARKTGIHPVTIWRYEHGRKRIPESVEKTLEMMEAAAKTKGAEDGETVAEEV